MKGGEPTSNENALDGSHIGVVSTPRHGDMLQSWNAVVGRVKVDPTQIAGKDADPGMGCIGPYESRLSFGGRSQEVSTDVPSGDPQRSHAADEYVREVLADPFSPFEHFDRSSGYLGRGWYVKELMMDFCVEHSQAIQDVAITFDDLGRVLGELVVGMAVSRVVKKLTCSNPSGMLQACDRFKQFAPAKIGSIGDCGVRLFYQAPRGHRQSRVDFFDAEKLHVIPKGVLPMEAACGFGLDIDDAVADPLVEQFSRGQMQLIMAQGTFRRILVMSAVGDSVATYGIVHRFPVGLLRINTPGCADGGP